MLPVKRIPDKLNKVVRPRRIESSEHIEEMFPESKHLHSKLRSSLKGGFWLAILALAFSGLIVASNFFTDLRAEPAKAGARTETLNNIRRLGLALSEFDAEYGRFPDKSTIPLVQASTGTKLTLDDSSSNKLFRQLIAAGLKSEKLFWAPLEGGPRKPDDVFGTDGSALRAGECAFAYIAGLKSSDAPEAPVVMAPLIKGKRAFDRLSFHGKAVILFLDNSAKSLPIEKDGRVMLNGMDIFDPRQPYWKGKAPDIKWPE